MTHDGGTGDRLSLAMATTLQRQTGDDKPKGEAGTTPSMVGRVKISYLASL